jgi:hypothetical protein
MPDVWFDCEVLRTGAGIGIAEGGVVVNLTGHGATPNGTQIDIVEKRFNVPEAIRTEAWAIAQVGELGDRVAGPGEASEVVVLRRIEREGLA